MSFTINTVDKNKIKDKDPNEKQLGTSGVVPNENEEEEIILEKATEQVSQDEMLLPVIYKEPLWKI